MKKLLQMVTVTSLFISISGCNEPSKIQPAVENTTVVETTLPPTPEQICVNSSSECKKGYYLGYNVAKDMVDEARRIINQKNALDEKVRLQQAASLGEAEGIRRAQLKELSERYSYEVAVYKACAVIGFDICPDSIDSIGREAVLKGYTSLDKNLAIYVWGVLLASAMFGSYLIHKAYLNTLTNKYLYGRKKLQELHAQILTQEDKLISMKASASNEIRGYLNTLERKVSMKEGELKGLVEQVTDYEATVALVDAHYKKMGYDMKRHTETVTQAFELAEGAGNLDKKTEEYWIEVIHLLRDASKSYEVLIHAENYELYLPSKDPEIMNSREENDAEWEGEELDSHCNYRS